jgi:hypothetical protein
MRANLTANPTARGMPLPDGGSRSPPALPGSRTPFIATMSGVRRPSRN